VTDRPLGSDRFRRPESVLVIIHTEALECLLLERVEPEAFWQSVTGTLHWDETPAETAAREVREETGIDPVGLVDAAVIRRFPILPEWQAVTINPDEHKAYHWLPLDNAIEAATSWTNREGFERLGRDRKKP
jgi:dATP pyrophosphohydrolase